jgi:hypothetical protein
MITDVEMVVHNCTSAKIVGPVTRLFSNRLSAFNSACWSRSAVTVREPATDRCQASTGKYYTGQEPATKNTNHLAEDLFFTEPTPGHFILTCKAAPGGRAQNAYDKSLGPLSPSGAHTDRTRIGWTAAGLRASGGRAGCPLPPTHLQIQSLLLAIAIMPGRIW